MPKIHFESNSQLGLVFSKRHVIVNDMPKIHFESNSQQTHRKTIIRCDCKRYAKDTF